MSHAAARQRHDFVRVTDRHRPLAADRLAYLSDRLMYAFEEKRYS